MDDPRGARLGGAAALGGHHRAGGRARDALAPRAAGPGSGRRPGRRPRLPAHAVPARVHGPHVRAAPALGRRCRGCWGSPTGPSGTAGGATRRWIALVVLTIGAVNASSLVLIGVGPLLWLLAGDPRPGGRPPRRRVGRQGRPPRAWACRSGGSPALRLQASHGMPVLQLTENLETVAATSTPSDVLRGLGNWFFYGGTGSGTRSTRPSTTSTTASRWRSPSACPPSAVGCRDRGPVAAPSPVRGAGAGGHRGLGRARGPSRTRAPTRAVVASFRRPPPGWLCATPPAPRPVIVLGLAGLLGAFVSCLAAAPGAMGGVGVAAALAAAGMWPVTQTGMLSEHLDRGDPIPAEWSERRARSRPGGHRRPACSRSRGRTSPPTAGATPSIRSCRGS